jgi:hypothetical protein
MCRASSRTWLGDAVGKSLKRGGGPLPFICLRRWGQLMLNSQLFLDRTLIFLLAIGGVICAGVVVRSCNFYHFNSHSGRPWPGLEPPFNNTVGANIGLFSYEITHSTELSELYLGCIDFDNKFSQFSEGNSYWQAAQYCAVFAFFTSCLAILINLFEVIFCSFYCSFIFASMLLMLAGVLQACTFMVLEGIEFW